MQDFALVDQAGETWRLRDALHRGAVVLVFYRGDW
jgi:peroxiredoxin